MQRRDFLTTLAAGAVTVNGAAPSVRAEPLNPETGFLLSTTGCSAATAHPAANKIVTMNGKTHVGWVDSNDERFQVRVRTLDRASGQWSPRFTLGDAFDNHGGPALTVDRRGFLHAVYYPHHHPFLKSPDSGKTWKRHDGTRVRLPATAETVTVIEHLPAGGLSCGSIGVDSVGTPYLVYGSRQRLPMECWLASLDASGQWQKRPLSGDVADLPLGTGWGPYAPCFVAFGDGGQMFVVVTMVKAASVTPQDTWHSSTNEIALLESTDGGQNFSSRLLTKPDLECPRRYVSLERPTGHNRIGVPGVIYTSGHSSNDNREVLHNSVYWIRPNCS